MPSKSNKSSSKSKSRLSKSDASPSPSPSPRSHSAASFNLIPDAGDDDLLSFIEEASRKFPFFIGKSALTGRVSDVVSRPKGCSIWLSEPSMVASSISPGSIVSVSLLRSGRRSMSDFPLSSLTRKCAARLGFDGGNEAVDAAGNYFVLATVFPSCKVLKDSVRLSSNLSNSLGSPAIGRDVFVYPVHTGTSLRSVLSGDYNLSKFDEKSLVSYNCKKLYLKLLPFQRVPKTNGQINVLPKVSSHTSVDQFGYNEVSSPQTPTHRNKLKLYEVDSASLSGSSEADSGSLDVREMFENETVKKLLEDCAASWLCSRSLLCKNIVTFSSLAKVYTFQVLYAESLSSVSDASVAEDSTLKEDEVAFTIDEKTKVYISLPDDSVSNVVGKISSPIKIKGMERSPKTSQVQKLGGLGKEYGKLMEIISFPNKNEFSRLSLQPTGENFRLTPKGVLLHGPPGTGKTSLAQLCASDAGVNFFQVNGPEIIKQYNGESEQELHKVFDAASKASPAVIFIDELDAIAPARNEGGDEISLKMVGTLLTLMDGISRAEGLLIIAATNRIESIEPALRRPGRFDREIEIGVPSPKQRFHILKTLVNDMEHSLQHGEIEHLSMVTHGFVGADLAALCNEAAKVCLRRYIEYKRLPNTVFRKEASHGCNNSYSHVSGDNPYCQATEEYCIDDKADLESAALKGHMQSPNSVSSSCSLEVGPEIEFDLENTSVNSSSCITATKEDILKVLFEDFEKARMRVRPSAMREIMLEVPRVKWEDVGGQEEIKQQLLEAVEWPQKHMAALNRIGVTPPAGVLLFGPPGCSKTLMARAVASEAGLNFLSVKGPELFSKWVGDSEKAVRSVFAKARANAPSVIFFDEIDSLAVIRGRETDGTSVADRVMSQLLVELDGLHKRVDVIVIAATNRPDKIDPALLRPGRFDRKLYVGPPNENDRESIFHIHLRNKPCSSDVDIRALARLTDGFTGADIFLISREAAIKALEENRCASEIKMEHLKAAIEHVPRSEIDPYGNIYDKFQGCVQTKAISSSMRFSFWNPFKWIIQRVSGFFTASS